MASVGIRDVRKSFGTTAVIHGVNVSINDGEFVVLVGPSGCGKSTLLRMIAGLENISGGEIRIGERVVNNVPPKERDVAMVFQNYALYPHMTVADNMAFSLKLRGADKGDIDARVNRAAGILGLGPYLARFPRQLSGGQRQRVAMGRAIVRDPQVFLFDEPLSNLDAKLRVQMRTEIKELHQRLKTTTVYVTHDQIEAMTMADKIVVMHDGIVEQIGSPLELYDRPTNQFVARTASSCRSAPGHQPIRTASRPFTASVPSTSRSPTMAQRLRSSSSNRPARRRKSSPSSAVKKLSPFSASGISSIRATRSGLNQTSGSSISSTTRPANVSTLNSTRNGGRK
jgi:ABC-type sugar transport system ATPase subunit